jgi:hypothetical protein
MTAGFQAVIPIMQICDAGHFGTPRAPLTLNQRLDTGSHQLREPQMIAVLAAVGYLGRITDRFFEAQMQRAAVRITTRSQRFDHQ